MCVNVCTYYGFAFVFIIYVETYIVNLLNRKQAKCEKLKFKIVLNA